MSATAHRYSCDQLGACQGRVNPCAGCAEPRLSEGAASVLRLHEAWRKGGLPLARPPVARTAARSIAGDPLRLDDGIPTLTDRLARQAERQQRAAPLQHRVHRVDTETDLPEGMQGVAIGYLALPEDDDAGDPLQGDTYAPRQITQGSKVDQVLRSRVWSALVAVYFVALTVTAWLIYRG
jgi:hypothetical protein